VAISTAENLKKRSKKSEKQDICFKSFLSGSVNWHFLQASSSVEVINSCYKQAISMSQGSGNFAFAQASVQIEAIRDGGSQQRSFAQVPHLQFKHCRYGYHSHASC
jgi:hypothetical protein